MTALVPIAHAHSDIKEPHLLAEHALNTGKLAASFASVFGSDCLAELVEKAPARVDHSSAGAR